MECGFSLCEIQNVSAGATEAAAFFFPWRYENRKFRMALVKNKNSKHFTGKRLTARGRCAGWQGRAAKARRRQAVPRRPVKHRTGKAVNWQTVKCTKIKKEIEYFENTRSKSIVYTVSYTK